MRINGQDLDFAFVEDAQGQMWMRNRSVVALRDPNKSHRAPAPDRARVMRALQPQPSTLPIRLPAWPPR
jgi:hypothetical protein